MLTRFTNRRIWLLVLVAMFAVPSVCHAHEIPVWFVAVYGTIWAFVICLPIALVEGSLLAWCFKAKWWRAVMIMLLANFVLFASGFVWMCTGHDFPVELPIDMCFLLTWGVAFTLALLVKGFFCCWVLGKQNKLKALLVMLLLNLVICTLLICWYTW